MVTTITVTGVVGVGYIITVKQMLRLVHLSALSPSRHNCRQSMTLRTLTFEFIAMQQHSGVAASFSSVASLNTAEIIVDKLTHSTMKQWQTSTIVN
jgi:hypothetical protein